MIKIIFIPFILVSFIFAEINEIDNNFLNFEQNLIDENTSDSELANEVKKIQAEKTTSDLENDSFDLEKYKQQLSESYEEAFKKQAKQNVDQQLKEYENIPEVQKIKEELYEMIDNQSIDEMSESFKGLSITIDNPDNNDDGSTIEVFNGDSTSSEADSASESEDESTSSFECECEDALSSAFDEFDEYYTENLDELHEQIEALAEVVEKNTKDLKTTFNNRDILNNEILEQNILLKKWIDTNNKIRNFKFLESN